MKSQELQPITSPGLEIPNPDETQKAESRTSVSAAGPAVFTVGLTVESNEFLAQKFPIIEAKRFDEIARSVKHGDLAVLVINCESDPAAAKNILSQCVAQGLSARTAVVLLGVGEVAESFNGFAAEDCVFYVFRGRPTPAILGSLVSAAAMSYGADNAASIDVPTAITQDTLDFCISMTPEGNGTHVAQLLTAAVKAQVTVERADCLTYDPAEDILLSLDATANEERKESPAAGLIGYAIRTRQRLQIERVASDSRYDAEMDNPDGLDQPFLIAEPIIAASGTVVAVLRCVRKRSSGPFSDAEALTIRFLASYAGAIIGASLLRARTQAAFLERSGATTNSGLYRQEALDHLAHDPHFDGALLDTSTPWLTRSYWLSLLLFFAVLGFVTIARMNEYAYAPAVVRARARSDVIAPRSGLTRSVEVSTGARVRRGDLLVRFQDAIDGTPLERLNEQIWSPTDGIVSDVRVRPGQHVSPGDIVVVIADDSAGYDLLVLMPDHYAPQLRAGMPLALKLLGYTNSRESLRIDQVGTEIVGGQEALRLAGKDSAASISASGPVVVVRVKLPSRAFIADNRAYEYRDGMTGEAEVNIRSYAIISAFIPGLKSLLD